MLFNSFLFIFIFLPIVLIGFHVFARRRVWAMAWLVASSLVFYGWWDWRYLFLLGGSVALNFALGKLLAGWHEGDRSAIHRHAVLAFGIAANLGCLGYFKYAGFVTANLAALLNTEWDAFTILLPLAISFFTFQQIAYLVDCHSGRTRGHDALSYALFVCFFPQLIAGPIVHYQEMMPQFARGTRWGLTARNLAIGGSIFCIGLFKKVVIADGIAVHASPMFAAAADGTTPSMVEAWAGVLCYTFQLYFDFSGYSDMAIGLARLFGIRLPENFRSPYTAGSIIEFWHRWHMTLSRFLRDYVYIPLGGNRHGKLRRHRNILLTMLLGGVWHGAGWTFVLWGGIHGVYLVANHGLRALAGRRRGERSVLPRRLGVAITFLLVTLAWVPFRSADLATTGRIYAGMFGANGIVLPEGYAAYFGPWLSVPEALGVTFAGNAGTFGGKAQLMFLLAAAAITWLLPNTQTWFARARPVLVSRVAAVARPARLAWRPTPGHAAAVAVAGALSVASMTEVAEFLYFQF